MYSEKFLRRAIELSTIALDRAGHEPFGAVVARNGRIVGEGVNRSALSHDPTSHGEIEAIRDACRRLETVDLSGCQLYTSCEPCALCVAAMEIAGISELYYAAGLAQANEALSRVPPGIRFAVDAERLRTECGKPVGERAIPSGQALAEDATEIIRAWASAVVGP